ncbi:LacI family DNA-binding transcriptional regulator [Halalkalibacter kiskunsagensis]|uniref:LacI family DNA-binding transcriptional regulator n=1 Tax=Halalkalibacter kiskunsagensis TaxID=1548599 RepID=A0ABV6KFP0_9BACI
MNPTIKDVARLARTSKSTVSRYLNGQPVKKNTEEALKSAIKELDYHPNINARRLVQSRTQVVGIVADDISNNFYSGILRGIEKVTNAHRYHCVYYSGTSNHQSEIDFLDLVQEGQVDGLIFISFSKRSQELLERIRDITIPIVLVGDGEADQQILSVDVDNQYGIHELIHYLHRIGHEKVAFIAGPNDIAATEYRTKGYKNALEELGLEYKREWIVGSDWSKEGGYKAMKELLKFGGFTALVASNDETAIGALLCAHELGFRVPQDFSIVGFDDIEIARWIYPTLTTIRQPLYEMGEKAADGLINIMKNTDEVMKERVLIRPELIVRNSCKNLL